MADAAAAEPPDDDIPWYIGRDLTPRSLRQVAIGDYVLATKWRDGDPYDHFCVGFYTGLIDHPTYPRHLVSDGAGIPFRANGFRTVAPVTTLRGSWILRHPELIQRGAPSFSVWHWWAASETRLRWMEKRVGCPERPSNIGV